jgi:hypothetical protein
MALALGLVLALALPAPAGVVKELTLFRGEGGVRVDLTAEDLLDERTALTVDSGLPGTCLMHLRVEDRDEETVAEQFVEWTLRYDLWENVYRLDGPRGAHVYETMAAADSAWSRLRSHLVCPGDRLHADRDYRLVVRIAVEPLAPEDRERLGRYVRRNSGGAGEELAFDVGAAISRLFGGSRGKESALRAATPYFRIDELGRRPREERP